MAVGQNRAGENRTEDQKSNRGWDKSMAGTSRGDLSCGHLAELSHVQCDIGYAVTIIMLVCRHGRERLQD